MREFSTPATYVLPARGNLSDDVLRHLELDPAAVLFRRREHGAAPAGWQPVTAQRFHDEVVGVAKGLVAADVRAGDRVGLLARTRYEWTLIDYALWWVGAVSVPIHDTMPADQIAWFLADSAAVACVVEHAEHLARIESVRRNLAELRHIWTIDTGATSVLTRLGADVDDSELEQRRSSVTPDALATLIYTPGTTGRPKGCRLTHGNFMVGLGSATDALRDLFATEDASTLLFLPLTHIFARTLQVGCVRSGATLGHSADEADLVRSVADFRPTFLLAVPRVLERAFTSATQPSTANGRARVLSLAASAAVAWSRAQDGDGPSLALRARHAAFERLVYRRLRSTLGGRLRYAVCGGGPLGDRLGHFFRGIGVTVLEGYGLSEATATLTVNLPDEQKVGTVGRPLPGVSVRVADDGELLFRGGQVFAGYWGDDERTAAANAEALADNWLHTGDFGEVDGEGFVLVAGRKDEILVTAGGKKVAPAGLESHIRTHPLVSRCLVVGDGRPYVAALITLDELAAAAWAATSGRTGDATELADDPDVHDSIQTAVDAANATVSQAESVRRFRLLAADWTEQDGHLTPSQQLKRAAVLRDYAAEVDSLYDPVRG